jgi:hypothetical protein
MAGRDWCTDDDIVDLVRALARHMPDQTIAAYSID